MVIKWQRKIVRNLTSDRNDCSIAILKHQKERALRCVQKEHELVQVNMMFVMLLLVYQCNLSLTETCISQKGTTFGQPDPGVPVVGKYLKLFPKTTLQSTVDHTRHNPYSQSQDCG